MHWYYWIAWFLIISQIFVVWFLGKNLKYALSNPWRNVNDHIPKTLLTVPCKGIDLTFDQNIESFFKQDYPEFIINFVVESTDDPAYGRLCELKEKFDSSSKAQEINILVAGKTSKCSQKIHNLLHSYDNCPDDITALAFADSDACVHSTWLREIVAPLVRNKTGVSTGYRWFVPKKYNIATIIMSITNAKVAQFLGKYEFNQAWGGSMAISREMFENLEVAKVWSNIVSDDLSLSYLVKKAKKKVIFVPTCIVASYESTTIPKLYEFARRQFIISRIYMPLTWTFALISSLYTVSGFWGSLTIAIYSQQNNIPRAGFYTVVPIVFIVSHWIKSIYRSTLVIKRLPSARKKLKLPIVLDFVFSPIYSVLLLVSILSSSVGRTITWRGIKYRLKSPYKTEILD